MDSSKKELIVAALALIVIVGGVYFFANYGQRQSAGPNTESADASGMPEMTPLAEKVLSASTGFQYLVSFTDSGFQPAELTVKAGETVRFTNNSSGELWVSAAGARGGSIYPGDSDSCGQSRFDVCQKMAPHDFWEFTFSEEGDWSYANGLDKSITGIVHVQ